MNDYIRSRVSFFLNSEVITTRGKDRPRKNNLAMTPISLELTRKEVSSLEYCPSAIAKWTWLASIIRRLS